MEGNNEIVDKLYFLRNNTFLKQEADLTNTEYKVLNLVMARMQKMLIKKYPVWNKNTVEKMETTIDCTISLNEIKQLNIRERDTKGEKLKEILEKLNNKQVRFVSYITGGYVGSHLIAEYEIIKTGNSIDIKFTMTKQVFMFLLDYNANFDFRENFPNAKEVQESPKPAKKLISRGYSKLEIGVVKKLRSYYSQIMFTHFKAELEKRAMKDIDIKEFTITYDLDWLRKTLGLDEEEKYKRFPDFRRNVLDVVKKELNTNKLFIIDYTENLALAKGRRRVVSIDFNVAIGEELDYNIPKVKNNIPTEEECVDVEFKEVKTTLAESLCAKLRVSSSIRLAVNTLQNFIDTYGEINVRRAVNSLMIKTEEERVRAPKKYLLTVLEDMYDRENNGKENISTDTIGRGNYISNNSQRLKKMREQGKDIMGFNNIPPVERDYDELERKLLGWDKDDDMVD